MHPSTAVHDDGRGFYGDDLDVAFRLLDAPTVKRALTEAASSPLVLVVSDEIFTGIVRHGYVDTGPYGPAVRVRVGRRHHRGWIHVPAAMDSSRPATIRRAMRPLPLSTPLSVTSVNGRGPGGPRSQPPVRSVNGHGAPRPGRG